LRVGLSGPALFASGPLSRQPGLAHEQESQSSVRSTDRITPPTSLGWRRRLVLQIRRCWFRNSSLKPSRTHTRSTSQGSLRFSNAPAEQSEPRCETHVGGRVDWWSGVDRRVPGPGQISCDKRHPHL